MKGNIQIGGGLKIFLTDEIEIGGLVCFVSHFQVHFLDFQFFR